MVLTLIKSIEPVLMLGWFLFIVLIIQTACLFQIQEEPLFAYFEEKYFVAEFGRVSLLRWLVDERTKFPLRAVLSFLNELLAHIGLVLVWVVEALEGRVRVNALLSASLARLLVIALTLFRDIEKLIWWPPVIERLVSIHAMVPIVVLEMVVAKLRFVSIQIEKSWLYGFQVVLQLGLGRL